MNKSEQLIACLESEIKARDVRIAELEAGAESLRLTRDHHHDQEIEYRRRWAEVSAELAALKAQEPVFMWHKGATEEESEVVDVDCACPCCVPLYAAPVVSSEQQGVVDVVPGLELAAKHLENEASEYADRFASYDHDTGATEFPSHVHEDYYNDLLEHAEKIRALAPAPSTTEGQGKPEVKS
jgi:hypothetical protein